MRSGTQTDSCCAIAAEMEAHTVHPACAVLKLLCAKMEHALILAAQFASCCSAAVLLLRVSI
jgi:hypothetical protein